jgi:hypothetical protein
MDLENKFRDSRLAWQGELVGPKVQGNRYDCRDYIIYFFDAYEIDRRHYLDFMDYRTAAANLKLPCVPLIHHELPLPNAAFADNEMPMKAILSLAEGKSVLNEKTEREGLVWKPIIESRDSRIGRVQFKAISNRFLLKNKE